MTQTIQRMNKNKINKGSLLFKGIGESLAHANGVVIDVPVAYLWRIYGVLLAYPWRIYGIPLAYPWRIFGLSMAYLWRIHGAPLAYPWRTFKKGNCDDQFGNKCNAEKN